MLFSLRRGGLISFLLVSTFAVSSGVMAQSATYPSRPIHIVVAGTAGGESDIIARLLAADLQPRLNVSVVVDNKPGAGVGLAAGYVAQAKPDGYTLLLAGSGLVISPSILKSALDPVKDFTPISQLLSLEFYLAVPASIKVQTLQELVQWTKSGAVKNVSYASAGLGSISHLQMEVLKSLTKIEALQIPYKGTLLALNGMLGGDTQLMFVGYSGAPHFRNGTLRPLAIAMPKRSTEFPQVPTIGEVYPDFNVFAWAGLVGPPNLPAAIVEKLNAAVAAVVAEPGFIAKMNTAVGGQPASSTPQSMGERLRSESARYSALALSLGIKPE